MQTSGSQDSNNLDCGISLRLPLEMHCGGNPWMLQISKIRRQNYCLKTLPLRVATLANPTNARASTTARYQLRDRGNRDLTTSSLAGITGRLDTECLQCADASHCIPELGCIIVITDASYGTQCTDHSCSFVSV